MLPMKDSTYSFIQPEDEPGLRTTDQRSRLLVDTVQNNNVRYIAIIYRRLKPPVNVACN